MKSIDMDISCSCSIGDDLRVYGSASTISRVQMLYGRRDRRIDGGLPANRRIEASRDGLGLERMNIGRAGTDEVLTVTGNSDAMGRMQAIYLADRRRQKESTARINPNWARNLAGLAPAV